MKLRKLTVLLFVVIVLTALLASCGDGIADVTTRDKEHTGKPVVTTDGKEAVITTTPTAVSTAAPAIAAPMLFASVTPLSTIRPITASLTFIFDSLLLIKNAPVPVTVRWLVGVLKLPYSRGKRYCLSAEQKCDDAIPRTLLANPD